MKITVEISHLAEVKSLLITLDRHRVGACILLLGFVVVACLIGLGWWAFR